MQLGSNRFTLCTVFNLQVYRDISTRTHVSRRGIFRERCTLRSVSASNSWQLGNHQRWSLLGGNETCANVTKSRTVKMICATWLLSVAITVLLYLSGKFEGRFPPIGQITSLVFYIVCTTVITTSYLKIFCKKTPSEEVFHIRAILEREKRTANTVGLILLVLLVTFLPGLLCALILYAIDVNAKPFRPFYGFLYALNGFLNPLLNFGRNKEMRRALLNLINCFQRVQPSLAAPASQQRQQQQQLQLYTCHTESTFDA